MKFGEFELLGELGRGGMGVVHRARHPAAPGEVALKVLLGTSGEDRLRFAREVAALSRLEHPGLVRVLAWGEDAGHPWLAMELLEGESLAARLRREGPLREEVAAHLIDSVARALDEAHRQGVLHRDLKPDNILVRPDGRPVLTDFGLSRPFDPDAGRLTATGEILGTPAYLAPEQALGERGSEGPASDVYGLGATLYALLTGQPPHGRGTAVEVLQRAATASTTPPGLLRPGLDPGLERVCLRCLERDPARRYPTAGALALALESWHRERLSRPRRTPALAGLVLGLGLLAAGGVLLAGRAPPAGAPPDRAADPAPPGGSSPGSPASPAALLARSRRLLAEDLAFTAEKAARLAWAAAPDSLEAAAQLALCQGVSGLYADAVQTARTAESLAPPGEVPWEVDYVLYHAELEQRRAQSAWARLGAALQRDPDNPRLVSALLARRLDCFDAPGARPPPDPGLLPPSERSDLLLVQVRLALLAEDWARGRALAEEALQAGWREQLRYHQARLLSRPTWRTVVEIAAPLATYASRPLPYATRLMKSLADLRLGQDEAALADLLLRSGGDPAEEGSTHERALAEVLARLVDTGDHTLLRALCRGLPQEDMDRVEAYLQHIARTFLGQGASGEAAALRLLDVGLSMFPGRFWFNLHQGRLRLRAGRPADCLASLAQAEARLERESPDPAARFSMSGALAYTRALALYRLGRLEEAREARAAFTSLVPPEQLEALTRKVRETLDLPALPE